MAIKGWGGLRARQATFHQIGLKKGGLSRGWGLNMIHTVLIMVVCMGGGEGQAYIISIFCSSERRLL